MINMYIAKLFYKKGFNLNKRTYIEKFEKNDFI